MKLDHTFIVIRERGFLEICDLSLHVIRDHARALLTLLVLNAIPWMAIDYWLVGWLVNDVIDSDYLALYYWLMSLLVVSQAQLGTSLLTYYLGQAMFVGRLGIWETVVGSLRASSSMVWNQGALRLVVPVLFFTWLTRHADEDTIYVMSFSWLPMLVATALLVRSLRPFTSEMLLLEKTPIRSGNTGLVNFSRRSSSLHGSAAGELFGRGLISALFLPLMTFAFYAVFCSVDSVLNLAVDSESSWAPWFWMVALWLAAGFAAVVRFLSYIDIRIRQEGWAVELKLRAEAQRLL